jgi:hypothetical protein
MRFDQKTIMPTVQINDHILQMYVNILIFSAKIYTLWYYSVMSIGPHIVQCSLSHIRENFHVAHIFLNVLHNWVLEEFGNPFSFLPWGSFFFSASGKVFPVMLCFVYSSLFSKCIFDSYFMISVVLRLRYVHRRYIFVFKDIFVYAQIVKWSK